jgi:hypothetical protein
MKNQINEVKRFQELAGLINENEKELSQFPGGKEYPSFANPLEGFPTEYKELLKKLQRSNDASERDMLTNKMNIIRKKLKLKPLTKEGVVNENEEELPQFSGGMEVTIKIPEKSIEWCREELGWEDDKIKQVFIDYIEWESQPLQHRVIIRNFENFVGTRIGSKGFQINKKNLLNKK